MERDTLTVETWTVDFQQAYTVLTGSVKIAGGKEAGVGLSTEGRSAQATGCRNIS